MAAPAASRQDGIIVGNQYLVENNRPLPSVGGLPVFGVLDQVTGRTDLMAIQLHRQFPARPRAFHVLTAAPIDGVLAPVAQGGSSDACFAICPAPPGPNLLARHRLWSESELLNCVLRPVAHALERLQEIGFPHRGIRLDNVFQGAPGQPVVLGVGWATPPAMSQPALFEPPYSAVCLPAGRGDGSIADDVYSLGVLLLCLAVGRVPLESLDDASVVRRKLEKGSYAALAGDDRLPPMIGDLVRGMLAEDPEHRPTPTLLLDPASARGRRVAARPPRRAQRSITLAGAEVWDARSLAYAMAVDPEQGMQSLRSGLVEQWLRRGLNDGQLASHLEELVHHRNFDLRMEETAGGASLLMRAIAVLDPLAPLCWRGIAIWPDGIGPAFAAAMGSDADVTQRLQEIVALEEISPWAQTRADRCDLAELRVMARQQRSWLDQRGQSVSTTLLTYLLNPMMPCLSPLMGNRWVARLADLLPALEATAGRTDPKQTEPIDSHIAGFVSARLERRLDASLLGNGTPSAIWLAQLRQLTQLQSRVQALKLPALAGWILARAGPALDTWRNRERRTAIAERLAAIAATGQLTSMLALIEDPAIRIADTREAQQAADQFQAINTELALIAEGGRGRAATAYRLGQEIAAGLALALLAAMLAVAALR